MNLDLTGKKAIVCGRSQGLGLATAVELALLGAEVTLLARSEQKLKDALTKLDASKGQHHNYLVADFQIPQLVKNAITGFMSQNKFVHILINNTGGPKGSSSSEATPEEFLQAYKNNLVDNQMLVQEILTSMTNAACGRMVNHIAKEVRKTHTGRGVRQR